ncbi:MAG: DUF4153 domain-containing protein, partial [Prevotella sp.]|nr:DUF4153 domain-containing protein [Prevotella sp.]
MMKTKIQSILRQLLRSPREFPVEAAMGFLFFCISAWHTGHAGWDSVTGELTSGVNADIIWLFVPLLILTFWLHKVNRWAYMASGLLFLPLMALNLKPFLWSYGFAFTYVLAAILLLVGVQRMDNRSFAAHALHVVTQLFFGLVVSGLLTGAVIAIVASFLYIFGIDTSPHIYEYILQFIWFFIAPQICCTFISQDEDVAGEPAKVLRLILNFILSPAIIIYTVILYIYFIKIVLVWDLPKGGVAWLVMGFITVALVGRLMQYVLKRHDYDWFYRNFTWIAIPPLIMYWVGSIYRIRLYSFTESRFYLMVAGALMTLFILMLLWRRTRRFQLMALILGAAIIVFTYIPGISAKSIGFKCQNARLQQFITDLKLLDTKTGKFIQRLNLEGIRSDSLLCGQYQEVCSIIEYVRNDMGRDAFTEKYGVWSWWDSDFDKNRHSEPMGDYYYCRFPIDLGEYNIMLPSDIYRINWEVGIVMVKRDDKAVLVYPIKERTQNALQLLDTPDSLFLWHNDSLMLVLTNIYLDANGTVRAGSNDFLL